MATPFVRPDTAALLAAAAQSDVPPIHEMAIEDARNALVSLGRKLDTAPEPLARVEELAAAGPAGPIPFRLYDARAAREGAGPVMVFFHGGGMAVGNPDSHDALTRTLAARLDLPVLSVDYRLTPEHPFPAPTDDAEAATRWIAANGAALGLALTGLVLAGDSAGGNLAAVTAMRLRDAPAAVPVVLQALLYPWVSIHRDAASYAEFGEGYWLENGALDFFIDAYAAPADDPRASPLLHDLAGMPPAVVHTAGLDVLRDHGRAYAAKLSLAGIDTTFLEAAGTIHGFAFMRRALPSTVADVDAFIAATARHLDPHR